MFETEMCTSLLNSDVSLQGGISMKHDNKPYTPAEDPYDIGGHYVFNRFGAQTWKPVALVFVGGAAAALKEIGWKGCVAVLAAGVLVLVAMYFIRKAIIIPTTRTGYINHHKLVTKECIMPREKKYHQKFYRLECSVCGKSQNIQAPNIRRARCPHCQTK
jgi:hypothetical protein